MDLNFECDVSWKNLKSFAITLERDTWRKLRSFAFKKPLRIFSKVTSTFLMTFHAFWDSLRDSLGFFQYPFSRRNSKIKKSTLEFKLRSSFSIIFRYSSTTSWNMNFKIQFADMFTRKFPHRHNLLLNSRFTRKFRSYSSLS